MPLSDPVTVYDCSNADCPTNQFASETGECQCGKKGKVREKDVRHHVVAPEPDDE